MKYRLLFSAMLVCSTFALTACDGGSDTAAAVNGTKILEGKATMVLPEGYKLMPQDMLEKKQRTRQLSIQEKEHKNELLMYLAHDLKTPLTSMIGYINHILDHRVDQEQLSLWMPLPFSICLINSIGQAVLEHQPAEVQDWDWLSPEKSLSCIREKLQRIWRGRPSPLPCSFRMNRR